mmetsp:Transcript_94717/g.305781  ORF Transcript_94717/g.305781 Transcript_94717/m.305781 type:complete len:308 (-) Transcript_94717:112-1035(-)
MAWWKLISSSLLALRERQTMLVTVCCTAPKLSSTCWDHGRALESVSRRWWKACSNITANLAMWSIRLLIFASTFRSGSRTWLLSTSRRPCRSSRVVWSPAMKSSRFCAAALTLSDKMVPRRSCLAAWRPEASEEVARASSSRAACQWATAPSMAPASAASSFAMIELFEYLAPAQNSCRRDCFTFSDSTTSSSSSLRTTTKPALMALATAFAMVSPASPAVAWTSSTFWSTPPAMSPTWSLMLSTLSLTSSQTSPRGCHLSSWAGAAPWRWTCAGPPCSSAARSWRPRARSWPDGLVPPAASLAPAR